MNQPKQYGDCEMMQDAISSQKTMTTGYNTFANECSSPIIMNELMNLLNEEHQMQHEIFDEMQKRGWYQTQPAPQPQVDQCKQKYPPI